MHKKLLRETPSCVMWINSRPYALCNWRNFAIVSERKKIQQEQQWKRLNNSLQFGWVSCYSFNGDGIYLEMQSSVKHCSAHIPPFLKHFNSPFEVTAKSLKRSSATRSDSSGKMCSNYGLNYTQRNILDDPRQTTRSLVSPRINLSGGCLSCWSFIARHE